MSRRRRKLLFNSENIPYKNGLLAWYDASLTPTGAVSSWYDFSNNGNAATQSTTLDKPICTANEINSLNALVMDGTNSCLFLPTAVQNAITKSTSHTMFFVFQAADLGAVTIRDLLNAAQGGADSDMVAISINNSDLRVGYYDGASYNAKSTAFADTSGAHILSVSHAANSAPICLLDGSTMSGSNNPSGDTADGNKLGGESQDNLKNFDGLFGEVLIYNKVLSSTKIAQIQNYLALKWLSNILLISKTGEPILDKNGSYIFTR